MWLSTLVSATFGHLDSTVVKIEPMVKNQHGGRASYCFVYVAVTTSLQFQFSILPDLVGARESHVLLLEIDYTVFYEPTLGLSTLFYLRGVKWKGSPNSNYSYHYNYYLINIIIIII